MRNLDLRKLDLRTAAKSAAVAAALLVPVVAVPFAGASPAAAAPPPIEGYVWGSQPVNPGYVAATGYEYNSAGGAVIITRSGPGRYQVRFRGMAGVGGVAHVSAYGNNAICAVSSWGPSSADELVYLRCFTSAGAPVDSRFIAHVTNRTDGLVRGYLWSSDATPPVGGYIPPAQYSFDSTGAPIVVSGTGVGSYTVDLGAFAQDSAGLWASGALRITAYGPNSAHCQALDPAVFADPWRLRVRCYGPTGLAVDTRFVLSYTRRDMPASATVDNYANPPTLAGWATNGGAVPSVALLGVGDYQVSFPGAGVAGGHAFVGVIGTPPMYCVIQSWNVVAGAMNLHVRCFAPGGGAPNPAVLHNAGFFV